MDRKRLSDEKNLLRVKKHRAVEKVKKFASNQNQCAVDLEASNYVDSNEIEENAPEAQTFDKIIDNNLEIEDDELPGNKGEGQDILPSERDEQDGQEELSENEEDRNLISQNEDNTGEKTNNNSDADSGSDSGSDSDSDSGSDTDWGSDTDSGSDLGSNSDLDSDSGTNDHVGKENEEEKTEEEEEEEDQHTVNKLREWAVNSKIPLIHLDGLLGILKQKFPTLPKCGKTFLKTTKARYNIIPMPDSNGSNGEFVYFGVAPGLLRCINTELHKNLIIELQINVDEIPLVKSADRKFCVMSCKVHCNVDIYQPYPVAIYSGESKPADVDLFLDAFVQEINDLQRDGIEISGDHFAVILKCIISDTLARAFIKCTVGHKGFNACERCTVTGYTFENRTVFPDINAEERMDASFRDRTQIGHHNGITPFTRIVPFLNMITITVFILDSMHLCFEGIMKKLLHYWVIKGYNKLKKDDRNALSRRMEMIRKQIPCEFQRKPRSTRKVAKWKATEFRFFLLYCGPIVLKNVLLSKLYRHFLLLHAACYILYSDQLCIKYTATAKTYLQVFFSYLQEYYGPSSQTVNSHHLIHLADDVTSMKCSLSKISAFPFENLLGKLKKQLRTPNRPLAQICRRLYEQRVVNVEKPAVPLLLEILEENGDNIVKIRYKQFSISVASPDNVVLLKNKSVLVISRIVADDDNINIIGQVWEKKESVFRYPFDSAKLKMYQLNDQPLNDVVTLRLTDLDCKMVCLSLNLRPETPLKTYVIPLLHN